MTNSLENILSLISGDKNATEKLLDIANSLSEKSNDVKNEASNIATNQDDRFSLKINLLKAIIPLLSEKAAQQAEFLIKLLTIISVIRQLNSSDTDTKH